jgi:hypothetical protein
MAVQQLRAIGTERPRFAQVPPADRIALVSKRWGDRFTLTSDQNQKMRFENDRTGYRIATSVGGWARAKGGDVIVSRRSAQRAERESDGDARIDADLVGRDDEHAAERPQDGARRSS